MPSTSYKGIVKAVSPYAFAAACTLLSAAFTATLESFQSWSVSIAVALLSWVFGQRFFGVLLPEPQEHIQETCARIVMQDRATRTEIIRKPGVDPVTTLRAILGDLETFNAVDMKGLMANLSVGDMMLSVNSCEVCDSSVLSSVTVENYLQEQKTACDMKGVLVRRLFRVGVAGCNGLVDRLISEPESIQKNLLELILKHVKLGFDVTLHMCADPRSYNHKLDYIIVFKAGVPIAFITGDPDKWELDTDGRKMYSGIRTSDPVVVGTLLKDRFPAQEGGHTDLNTFCRELVSRLDTSISSYSNERRSTDNPYIDILNILETTKNLTLEIARTHRELSPRLGTSASRDFSWLNSTGEPIKNNVCEGPASGSGEPKTVPPPRKLESLSPGTIQTPKKEPK